MTATGLRRSTPSAFFLPDGDTQDAFFSTELTRGPWNPAHQHGGPPTALLARAIERLAQSTGAGRVARLTVEFLRPIPIARLSVTCEVTRAGRTVQELVAHARTDDGQPVVRAIALCMQEIATPLPAHAVLAPAPALPETSPPWEFPFFVEPIGYHVGMELRVAGGAFGSGAMAAWMRMRFPLLPGEEPSPLQRVVIAADSGNGLSVLLDPKRYTFVNPDLTVYLHRMPEGEWVLLDARTVASPTGVGLAEAKLSDQRGEIGRSMQSLVVRARKA